MLSWRVIKIELNPHLIKLMSPEDQARYQPGIHPLNDSHPPSKTDRLEREEQRQFANHCLRKRYPSVWHSTAHRSKASIGCPDFIVGVRGVTLWIEFKRSGFYLSDDQEKFEVLLNGQDITLYVVHTAWEAIELCNRFDVRKGVQVHLDVRKGVQVHLVI